MSICEAQDISLWMCLKTHKFFYSLEKAKKLAEVLKWKMRRSWSIKSSLDNLICKMMVRSGLENMPHRFSFCDTIRTESERCCCNYLCSISWIEIGYMAVMECRWWRWKTDNELWDGLWRRLRRRLWKKAKRSRRSLMLILIKVTIRSPAG